MSEATADLGILDAQLLNSLTDSAAKFVTDTLKIDPRFASGHPLEWVLKEFTLRHFWDKYGYSYDKDLVNFPPSHEAGPQALMLISTLIVAPEYKNDPSGYIERNILSPAMLPSWMRGKCALDLQTSLDTAVENAPGEERWAISTNSYGYQPETVGDAEISILSAFILANDNNWKDTKYPNMRMFYFVGAFYNNDLVNAIIRTQLRQKAYSLVPETSVTPTNNAEMSVALLPYAEKLFQKKFGYRYNTTPPDVSPNLSPYERFNTHMFYILDLLAVANNKLDTMIEELLSGLDFKNLAVKAKLSEKLRSAIMSLLGDSTKAPRQWHEKYLSEADIVDGMIIPPPRLNCLLLTYWDLQTLARGLPGIETYYYYCMITVYEDVEYKNAVLLPTGITGHDMTAESLKEWFFDYGSKLFKDAYGFEYQKAGESAPNQLGDSFVIRFAQVISIEQGTQEEIKTLVKSAIFDPGTTSPFPNDISTAIFDSIVQRLQDAAESAKRDHKAGPENRLPLEWKIQALTFPFKEYGVIATAIVKGVPTAANEVVSEKVQLYYQAYFCRVNDRVNE